MAIWLIVRVLGVTKPIWAVTVENLTRPHASLRRRRRQGGFSSVRLLIGTALFSAVVEVVSPRLTTLSMLEMAERAVLGELKTAKVRAIGEDRCVQVRIDEVARTVHFASKRTVDPCGTTGFANDGPPRPIDNEGAVAIDATADPVFDTWGHVPTPAVITLKAKNGTLRIVKVDEEGRIGGP